MEGSHQGDYLRRVGDARKLTAGALDHRASSEGGGVVFDQPTGTCIAEYLGKPRASLVRIFNMSLFGNRVDDRQHVARCDIGDRLVTQRVDSDFDLPDLFGHRPRGRSAAFAQLHVVARNFAPRDCKLDCFLFLIVDGSRGVYTLQGQLLLFARSQLGFGQRHTGIITELSGLLPAVHAMRQAKLLHPDGMISR